MNPPGPRLPPCCAGSSSRCWLSIAALGLAAAGRIAWVGYGPQPGASVTAEQVRFLQRSIAAGDGARMQRLFPEGTTSCGH